MRLQRGVRRRSRHVEAVLRSSQLPRYPICSYVTLKVCVLPGFGNTRAFARASSMDCWARKNKVIKRQPASASAVLESKTSTAPHARQRRRVADLLDLVGFYKLSREKPEVVFSVLNIFSRNNALDHALHWLRSSTTVCVIYCHSKVFMVQATRLCNLICNLGNTCGMRVCVFVLYIYI